MENENNKKSMMIRLLYGEIDSDLIKMSDKYSDIIGNVNKYDNELSEKLQNIPELIELFKMYKNYESSASVEETNAYFEYGFKNGLLLGLEIGSSD